RRRTISREEYAALLGAWGLPDAAAHQAFARLDRDFDGFLSVDEFAETSFADFLRLNLAIPPAASPNILGVLGASSLASLTADGLSTTSLPSSCARSRAPRFH